MNDEKDMVLQQAAIHYSNFGPFDNAIDVTKKKACDFLRVRSDKTRATMLVSPLLMVLWVHAVYSRTNMAAPETTFDEELLSQAELYYQDEKLLQAARSLRSVKQKNLLSRHHNNLLRSASLLEKAVESFLAPPCENEWKKQGESHGAYETSIYYKVESGAKLTCRIETPIPKTMLVPILSVLNESGLYKTWIPSWSRPVRLGLRECDQILHDRKGHQIIHLTCDVPWPFAAREGLMDVVAVDDIEATGCIIAKMRSVGLEDEKDTGLLPDGFELPAQAKGTERIDFDGALVFRACPKDHPNYEVSRQKHSDDLIFLQYTMYFDAKMSAVPQTLINFVTRVVIGVIWNMLLSVAEEVRDGKRQDHLDVIREKADFYSWLEGRCQLLLDNPPAEAAKKQEPQEPRKDEKPKEVEWTMHDVMKLTI